MLGALTTAGLDPALYTRWTPHPVIVAIRDNKDYIRVLLDSYYTTITGWGVLLNYTCAWWFLKQPRSQHQQVDGV